MWKSTLFLRIKRLIDTLNLDFIATNVTPTWESIDYGKNLKIKYKRNLSQIKLFNLKRLKGNKHNGWEGNQTRNQAKEIVKTLKVTTMTT